MASQYPYSPLPELDNTTESHRRRSQGSPGSSEAASEYSRQATATPEHPSEPTKRPQPAPSAPEELASTSEEPKPGGTATRREFDWAGSWIWEVGGATLSIVCIALLIGFLVYVNGSPYPDWQYQASPNTVVSIIVTIAKTALLVPVSSCLSQLKWTQYRTPKPLYHMHVLDQASRGPCGALEALWVLTPSLATAGAILTILALAVDPFAQQILVYPSRRVVAANGTASVQKAQEYFPEYGYDTRAALPETMQAAILNGISETHSPLEPACSSGDCEYPDFVSLGICSRCEDVTQQADQSCAPREGVGPNGPKHRYIDTPTNCNYTGSSSPTTYLGNHDGIVGVRRPMVALLQLEYPRRVITFTPENATEVEPMPNMAKCALYACEKQYTRNAFSFNHRQIQPTGSQPLVTADSGNLVGGTALLPPAGTATLSDNSTYSIDSFIVSAMEAEIAGLFSFTGRFDGPLPSNVYKTPAITVILRERRDIAKSLSSVATSMTDAIRAHRRPSSVPRQAFRTATFIHARWPWIIFPVITVGGPVDGSTYSDGHNEQEAACCGLEIFGVAVASREARDTPRT
ncbi:hypothetical protein PHISP_02396 [Aspergillus sp. HF37]|nr:hypothetical protein PHISP_02396 [Aspergillus sp. HF37]